MQILEKDEFDVGEIGKRCDMARDVYVYCFWLKDGELGVETNNQISKVNFAGLKKLFEFDFEYEKFISSESNIILDKLVKCSVIYSNGIFAGIEKDEKVVDIETGHLYSLEDYLVMKLIPSVKKLPLI